MEGQLSSVLIGLASSTIVAFVTYFFTVRGNQVKQMQLVRHEQKFKYFFPFQHQSMEFKHRIKHIATALTKQRGDDEAERLEKYNKMHSHFGQQIFPMGKNDWPYIDFYSRDENNLIPGGYFLLSTLHMHCLLFRQINILQEEYPFILLSIKTGGRADETEKAFAEACNSQLKNLKAHAYFEGKITYINENCAGLDNHKLIELIRLSTTFSGGLSYHLCNSFGDYISKPGGGIMNYEEFCSALANYETRIKFLPLLQFWQLLGGADEHLFKKAIASLHALYLALELVECAKLKE